MDCSQINFHQLLIQFMAQNKQLHGKQEKILKVVLCNWFVLASILLANSNKMNLNLSKFSRHELTLFSPQTFWNFHKSFFEQNSQTFCPFKFATFSLQNVTGHEGSTCLYIKFRWENLDCSLLISAHQSREFSTGSSQS